jgi:protein-L-isoaspartate O-methyltransferase
MIEGAQRRSLLGRYGWLLAAAVLVVAVIALAGDREREVDRLARLLDLEAGDSVADIGAGDGWLSLEVAEVVGSRGHVFATELSAALRDDIREAVARAGLDNVTVVEAGEHETNLPAGCCDAIFMRRVYHHLADAPALNASLHESLKPGGSLAIVEREFTGIMSPFRGWPHWTDDAQVVSEVTATGLMHVTTDDWPGVGNYVAVFRK